MGQHFRGRLRRQAIVVVLAVAGVGAISGTSQAAPSHDAARTRRAPRQRRRSTSRSPATAATTSCTTTSPSAIRRRPIPRCSQGRLSGVATVTLRAKQNLESLNFDLRGLGVTSVQVDGKAAKWSQVQDDANRIWELTVGLRPKLKAGQTTTIVDRVRRNHRPAAGHHRSALRLGHHR